MRALAYHILGTIRCPSNSSDPPKTRCSRRFGQHAEHDAADRARAAASRVHWQVTLPGFPGSGAVSCFTPRLLSEGSRRLGLAGAPRLGCGVDQGTAGSQSNPRMGGYRG